MQLHRGVVRLADHPALRSSWARHAQDGRVVRALPGVVMDAVLVNDPGAWIRAVHAWDPNAIVAGRAAASLTFAPDTAVGHVLVYTSSRMADRGMIRFRRHALHQDLISWVGDLRVTTPAATGLTAALEGDYEPVTTALRLAVVDVEMLNECGRLLTIRPAAGVRSVLRDVSSNPWSVAEVEAHRLLRGAGITGWLGNEPMMIDGRRYVLDIPFPAAKVAFEVNSFEFHSSKQAMMHDAGRANALLAAGWRSYVLMPTQIVDHPDETLHFIRRVVRLREQRSRDIRETEIFRP